MAIITNRDDFKSYVLRACGHPLITVDVTEEHLDDRIDDAILFFNDYYWDGIKKEYFKHQLTATNMVDRYVTIPDHIWSVSKVFNASSTSGSSGNIFDLEYQLRMSDMRDLTSTSLVYYEQVMSHIALLQHRLHVDRQFRFNRLDGKLFLDLNWEAKLKEGDWILLECYAALDPATSPKMWNDRVFKEYVVSLIKQQWAQNLSKYQGVQLPGGVTIDSQTMYANASSDIEKIEQEIMTNLAPLEFNIG